MYIKIWEANARAGRQHTRVRPSIHTQSENNPTMKNKTLIGLMALLPIAVLMTSGCAATRVEGTPSTETDVSLTRGNYKMVKAGAEGKSYGFRLLLGIIPITAPETADTPT
jgi:hypothetical protein